MGLGIDGKMQVHLDVSHLTHAKLKKIESILDIYTKFTGEDPRKVPMKIFPAVHYSMGGLWVDWPAADDTDRNQRFRQMTNIPGCFCAGEAEYQYHGANRLGANSLLSCIFGGLVAGKEMSRYVENLSIHFEHISTEIFDATLRFEEDFKQDLFNRTGLENVFILYDELADVMVKNVTVKRNNQDFQPTIDKIKEIRERYKKISLADHSTIANQTYAFANQFKYMLELALVITKGALLRNEFRGSHFKDGYTKRDDAQWLKTTIAEYARDEPIITYENVDLRHFDPIERDYVHAKQTYPEIKNMPSNIEFL